jgi:predicted transcriptional regulator YdeE
MAVALLTHVLTHAPSTPREASDRARGMGDDGDEGLAREAGFRLITHGELWVAGVVGCGPFRSGSDPASGWVTQLWGTAQRRAAELPDSVDKRGFLCPHFGRETEFTYYIGFESAAELTDLPKGMVCIKIPAHTWAVGLVEGREQIERVYSGLGRWLEAQGYEEVPRALAIEAYPPDGPRPGDSLVFDVLLPVRRRPVAGSGRRREWDWDPRRTAYTG